MKTYFVVVRYSDGHRSIRHVRMAAWPFVPSGVEICATAALDARMLDHQNVVGETVFV